ncbi:uncharacterized protein LOC131930215 [Physella acuta]|uniref:uncharacterized protein LOC131930215 n=1 Tax=Physella acuta TaxID=109671 RepID=UPI0027DAC811|nr:uncharacterized protein LOC131930215 [Physella acuta]
MNYSFSDHQKGEVKIPEVLPESLKLHGDGLVNSNWIRKDLIGRGTFASVYDVELSDGSIPNKLAVKAITICSIDKEKAKKTIDAEKSVLNRLNHERIVPVYTMHEHELTLYIFMERFSMGTLDNHISKKGALDEDTTRMYTKQILEGVAYLHEEKFIHRDIKGANVLLESSTSIRLADFGTAKLLGVLTSASTTNVGTCNWTAPEVFEGVRYTTKVDIWSVGCTVVQMLCGQPPFHGLEPLQIIRKHIMGAEPEYVLSANTSRELQNFLYSTLQKDPNERPPAKLLLNTPFITGTKFRPKPDVESDSIDETLYAEKDRNRSYPNLDIDSNQPVIINVQNCRIKQVDKMNVYMSGSSETPKDDQSTSSASVTVNVDNAENIVIDSYLNRADDSVK